MILPYLIRLAILSLACFFLVHVALAVAMNLLAPWLMAMAKRSKPRSAASLLLAARLFPSAAALFVVAGICVPSYLWLEPDATVEPVGLACLAAAFLSVMICGISARRGLRAMALSIRYERHCRRLGQETKLALENTPVSVIEDAAGLFALSGILHPRLVISREVLRNLSAGELEAALRHECAHGTSCDNLKRLLLLLAPDILPFRQPPHMAGLESLERGWSQFTEWAADDKAVDGDSRRAVSLAGALVRVARMGVPAEASPLMTSLLADGRDLEARVNRLLSTPSSEKPAHSRPMALAAIALASPCFVAAMNGAATLQAAHQLLEHLIR